MKEGGHQDSTQEDGRTAKMHWELNKAEKRRKLSPALTDSLGGEPKATTTRKDRESPDDNKLAVPVM